MQTEAFRLQIDELLFSSDGKSLDLKATLSLGDISLTWGTEHPPISVHRVMKFLREVGWPNAPYMAHDLSTNDDPLSFTWEPADKYSAICLIRPGAEGLNPIPISTESVREAYSELDHLIFKHCCHNLAPAQTSYWHDLFCKTPREENAEFHIGQRIKTIPGENVKTERTGWISSICYHDKRKCYQYKILIGNKVYKKFYYTGDLEALE